MQRAGDGLEGLSLADIPVIGSNLESRFDERFCGNRTDLTLAGSPSPFSPTHTEHLSDQMSEDLQKT